MANNYDTKSPIYANESRGQKCGRGRAKGAGGGPLNEFQRGRGIHTANAISISKCYRRSFPADRGKNANERSRILRIRERAREAFLNVSKTTLPPPFDILRDGKLSVEFLFARARGSSRGSFALANGDCICTSGSPIISAVPT